jgi:hypothetical protein
MCGCLIVLEKQNRILVIAGDSAAYGTRIGADVMTLIPQTATQNRRNYNESPKSDEVPLKPCHAYSLPYWLSHGAESDRADR